MKITRQWHVAHSPQAVSARHHPIILRNVRSSLMTAASVCAKLILQSGGSRNSPSQIKTGNRLELQSGMVFGSELPEGSPQAEVDS
jgi:hypothetical protein